MAEELRLVQFDDPRAQLGLDRLIRALVPENYQ